MAARVSESPQKHPRYDRPGASLPPKALRAVILRTACVPARTQAVLFFPAATPLLCTTPHPAAHARPPSRT